MTPTERENIRKWAATWQKASPLLEAIREEELRALDGTSEDTRAQIDALIAAGLRHAVPRETSGLVEQQRLFAIIRARQASARKESAE